MNERKPSPLGRRIAAFLLKYGGVAALFFFLGTAFGMYVLLRDSPNLWLRNEVLAMFAQRQQDPGGQNAALRYWQAWRWAGTDDVIEADMVQAELRDSSPGLSRAQRRALEDESVQSYVQDILRATRHHECDFGIDYQDGADTHLSHLGRLRGSARILAGDAYLKAIDGEPEAATERIVAILAIARHASSDRQLISSLIAGALGDFAIGWADRMLEEGLLTKGDLAPLEPELRRVASWDLGMREAFQMQRSQSAITIAILPFRADGLSWGEEPDLKVELSLHLTGTLIEQTESIQALYDDVLAVWDLPNSAAELQRIESEAALGVYGETARPLAPIFAKAFGAVCRLRDRAADLGERLENDD